MDCGTQKRISKGERFWHVFFAVALLVYGSVGLYYDDIYIPAKHSRGLHVHGTAAWIMYCAFICASLNLVSIVADHCDASESEKRYHIFARTTQIAGWAFFFGSVAFSLFPSKRQW